MENRGPSPQSQVNPAPGLGAPCQVTQQFLPLGDLVCPLSHDDSQVFDRPFPQFRPCGICHGGSVCAHGPMPQRWDLSQFTWAPDAPWKTFIHSIARHKSSWLPSPRTVSSANARTLAETSLLSLMPSHLGSVAIALIQGSKLRLKGNGDHGHPWGVTLRICLGVDHPLGRINFLCGAFSYTYGQKASIHVNMLGPAPTC